MLEKEIEQVVHLKDVEALSFATIGARLGFSERTARRRYHAGLVSSERDEQVDSEEYAEGEFPPVDDYDLPKITGYLPEDGFGLVERFTPMEITGDAFVTSDWHVPLHDPALVNKMFNRAALFTPKNLLINGDFWHMETFSSFIPNQPEAALPVERMHGNLAIKNALQYFEHIYLCCGNHDFRLVKKLGFKKSFEEAMDWMFFALTDDERSRLHVSSLDYMHYYPGDGRKYRVCHPRSFSVHPLTVPRALAVKYGCSVITGHSHHLAMGFAQDGHNLIMDSGGFYAKDRTEYIQASTRNHEWVQGWIEFYQGTPDLRSPNLNNVD